MAAHVARADIAGIDRRPPGRQQREERRLRPLQMECDFVVAIRGQLSDVHIPRLAWIDTELVLRLVHQEIKGAIDVSGGKWLAVMPFDARLTAWVDSSSGDMLAGLSKCPSLKIPPGFWANAALADANPISPLRTDSLPLVSKIYWRRSADDAIMDAP